MQMTGIWGTWAKLCKAGGQHIVPFYKGSLSRYVRFFRAQSHTPSYQTLQVADKLEIKLYGSIPANQHGDLNFVKFPPDNIPSNLKCKAVLSLHSTQRKGQRVC